ncbi:MAG: FAD-dependent oxidoreductase [Gammaproteobacteria bacterium]
MINQPEMNRSRHLQQLANETFDLLVIGGGISGACLAYDAVCRGLSVALIEKEDFGGATSASSSGVLHGGIRYLQQGRIDKVRESAFERVRFQNLAPHLSHYISFLVPTFPQISKGKLALRMALWAYAIAGAGQNRIARNDEIMVPPASLIDAEKLRRMVPILQDNAEITGAAVLPEALMENAERMTLAFVTGAARNDASVANYVRAESTRSNEGGERVTSVRDAITGDTFDITSRVVANCAGPWIAGVNDRLLGTARAPITGYSRGAHIVVRDIDLAHAVALPTKQQIQGFTDRGGRHMFLIPWRGHALIGTSYAAHDDSLDAVTPLADDMDQLVAGINDALGTRLVTEEKICHAWAGIYPLTASNVDASVYQGTGDYSVIDHERADNVPGYVSVFGAKFTTARLLAEKACNLIVKKLPGTYEPCRTRDAPLPSGRFESLASLRRQVTQRAGDAVSAETLDALIRSYGVDALDLLDMIESDSRLAGELCDDRTILHAEILFAARFEMVARLDDFVFRRTGLGTLGDPGDHALRTCAESLGVELGWSAERVEEELRRTRSQFPVRKSPSSTERLVTA